MYKPHLCVDGSITDNIASIRGVIDVQVAPSDAVGGTTGAIIVLVGIA